MRTPPPAASDPVLHILPVAAALGAPQPGPAAAPAALLRAGLADALRATGRMVEVGAVVAPEMPPPPDAPMAVRLQANAVFAHRLAEQLAALPADRMPLILGGDHAIALGSWRGIARRQAPAPPPGLIWIDAHLDSHTELSTHSGNIHGMPLAALLGEGADELVGVPGPVLDPARVCVLGARAWEPEERVRLDRLGVQVFDQAHIARDGLQAVCARALAIARSGGGGFGLSLDLDALDPQDMPAVLCPEPQGLRLDELLACLRRLRDCEDLCALEIVEYLPGADPDGAAAARSIALAVAALGRGEGGIA